MNNKWGLRSVITSTITMVGLSFVGLDLYFRQRDLIDLILGLVCLVLAFLQLVLLLLAQRKRHT